MRKPDRNVGLEFREILFAEYGFEQGPYNHGGNFLRIVDAQHCLHVNADRWDAPGGGAIIFGLRIGVGRRDNNQLWRDLLDDRVHEWSRTVALAQDVLGEPLRSFHGWEGARPDMAGWLEENVPRLVEFANHSYIVETLAENSAASGTLDLTRFPRMMEALMGGWNDAKDEEFLAPMIDQLDEDPAIWKDDPDGSIRQGKIDRVRAWIEAHPDGVERELLN